MAARHSEVVLKPLGLHHSDKWKLRTQKDGVTFEDMPSPFCDKKAVRITVSIPSATVHSFEKIVADDPDASNVNSYAYKFDTMLKGRHLIKRVDANTIIACAMYKTPVIAVAPRDFVMHLNTKTVLTTREEQEELGVVPKSFRDDPEKKTGAVFFQSAIDNGREHPNENTKYLRGALHAWLLMAQEEKDGSLTVTMTMSVDPQGNIPAVLMDLTSSEQIKMLKTIRSLVSAVGPLPPQPNDMKTEQKHEH